MTGGRAWYPADAEFSCGMCGAEYPSPVHGQSLLGGSVSCASAKACPLLPLLRSLYPQPQGGRGR